jgi:hypothetical protein
LTVVEKRGTFNVCETVYKSATTTTTWRIYKMKKRFLPITLAIMLIITFIPFGPAALAEGEFTARFEAQFDPGVNDDVGEWPDLGEFEVKFELEEEAHIVIEFDAPVAFGGNYAAVNTDVPFPGGAGAITSFKLDGQEIRMRPAFLNGEGIDGGLRLTLCNKWNSDIATQPVDVEHLGEFSKIEITFIAGIVPAGGNAWIGGTFLDDGEFDWISFEDQKTEFIFGEQFTATLDFGSDTNEHGEAGWGFITVVQTDVYHNAGMFGATVESILVDGNEIELASNFVEVGFDDGLRISLTNAWADDPLVASPEDIGEFSKLEVVMTFTIGSAPPPIVIPQPLPDSFAMAGEAWIGGTFLTDDGSFDWIPFEDQKTPFEVGVPFTVTLDLGEATQTHGEADWGFITVVQTDIQDAPAFYDAFIEKILVDGREIDFRPENIELGMDGGLRLSLTNGWADNPVVSGPNIIGEFSKLEVIMAFTEAEAENPFGHIEPELEAPVDPPPLITPPPDRVTETASEGLPGWVLPVIIAGAIIVIGVVVFFIMKGKKK